MHIRFLGLVALVLIASGCIGPLEQSTEQNFKDISTKTEKSSYLVTYDISRERGILGNLPENFLEKPRLYSYQNMQKAVIKPGMLGPSSTRSIYNLEGKFLDCNSKPIFGTRGETRVQCRSIESFPIPTTSQFVNNLDLISSNGTRNYAGRSCKMFKGQIRNISRFNSVNLRSNDLSNSSVSICLDKQKGFISYLQFKVSSSTGNSQNENIELLTLQARDHKETVSKEALDPPVDFKASIKCKPLKIEIDSFDYEGKAQVVLNGKEVASTDLETGESFEKNIGKLSKSGANEITISTSEKDQKRVCYKK
jgi:hypothetical protein